MLSKFTFDVLTHITTLNGGMCMGKKCSLIFGPPTWGRHWTDLYLLMHPFFLTFNITRKIYLTGTQVI